MYTMMEVIYLCMREFFVCLKGLHRYVKSTQDVCYGLQKRH